MRAGTFGLWSMVVTLAACGAPAPEVVGDNAPLEITYVANEGLLLSAAEDKVLIDGLFRDGVEGYATPPVKYRDAVESGEAPFDAVDLVLATHYHADHFDALAVCRFLDANPLAEFVSTQQAVDQMRAACEDPAAFEGRVRAALTADREPVPYVLGSLRVDPVFLHHGKENPVENVAFTIEIGGWTVLHLGDSEAMPDEIAAAGLGDREIDLAFVPYWYLLDRDWRPAIRDVLNPAGIVAMHVPPPGSPHLRQDWDALAESIQSAFDNAVVFKDAFDSRTFREKATASAP